MSYQYLNGFRVKQQHKKGISLVVSGTVAWSPKDEFMTYENILSIKYQGKELIGIYDQAMFSEGSEWDTPVRQRLDKAFNKAVHVDVTEWRKRLDIEVIPLECKERERSIEIQFPTGGNITCHYKAVRAVHRAASSNPVFCNMLYAFSMGDVFIYRSNKAEFALLMDYIDDPERERNGHTSSELYRSKRSQVIEAPKWTIYPIKDSQDKRERYKIAQDIFKTLKP